MTTDTSFITAWSNDTDYSTIFSRQIEAIAKNSPTGKESSIGKELGEISLPEGATIGALIRDNKGKIAHDHVHLRENDHVIVFLTDKKAIKQVKETFSPG